MIALLLIGSSGVLIASWELSRIFHVPLESMPAVAAATLSNQYRFLKAMELSCGCFSWWWRKEIFSDVRFMRLFLVIVWGGVGGRLLSMIADGVPSAPFLAFIVIEALTGILMLLNYARMGYGQQ